MKNVRPLTSASFRAARKAVVMSGSIAAGIRCSLIWISRNSAANA
jgi:hypothetical protein